MRLLLLCLIPLLSGCFEQAALPADRALFVTPADLAACGLPAVDSAPDETLKRTRYLDGSVEVEYEYNSPEDADGTIFLFGNASFERNIADAMTTYTMQRAGLKIGIAGNDLVVRERPEFFAWGQQHYFADVVSDGEAVGHLFATRSGKRVYIGGIVGVACETPDHFSALITPKLRYLDKYALR